MFANLKQNEEIRYENLPLKTHNGTQQEVEVVANSYLENGRNVIQCNIRDITARKHAEAILRRSEALFSAIIEQAPAGIYVVDSHQRLLQVNPTALPIFANIHPLIGRSLIEILFIMWPKRIATPMAARFRHTLQTGEPYESPPFNERRKDNKAREDYEWQLQRIVLPNGEHGVVCFFNNITERIKAESAQRRLDVMAASNQKLIEEIAHRQEVEQTLHETEYVQSRLLEHSLQQQVKLRSMSHKILSAQEDERKRISRELHDVITQTLVGINVHVATLGREATVELGTFQQRIANTQKIVEKSVEIVHQFARELRPSVLDDLGLIPALQDLFKGFMESTGIRVSLEVSATIEKFPERIRTTFYRIIQEALANVTKHAKASKVEIRIQRLARTISLQITDDGHGFEMEEIGQSSHGNHLGLLGMRERAEMIGGKFSVESSFGSPTTVRVIVNQENKKSTRRTT